MNAEGFPLDLYLEVPFSKYLDNMSNDGTYGDKITLRVAAELFNIEFVLVSTLRRAVEVTVTPRNFSPQNRAFLGHLAQNQEEHYVVLDQIDEVSTTAPNKSFGDLPPELIKRILPTVICNCGYVWPSHVVYTFNALRNVCRFWRVEVDATAMTYLPHVYSKDNLI